MAKVLKSLDNLTDAQGTKGHFTPIPDCSAITDSMVLSLVSKSLYEQITDLMFPYRQVKYPGRMLAMSRSLGCSVKTYMTYAKRGGDNRLTVGACARAEKICSRYIQELTALREAFETRRLALEAKKTPGPWRGGMFQVRVRDETGIPRTGLARDGWRRKKSEPPPKF